MTAVRRSPRGHGLFIKSNYINLLEGKALRALKSAAGDIYC